MMQDMRYAGRWLFRNPLFTMAIVLTMALAIGANTAIFSVMNAALFPPLPYEDSDRLVEIWEEKNRITIDERSPAVIVINETFVRKFWPGKDPIGKRVHLSYDPPVFAEVIGVVRDMKQHLDVQTEPEVYVPYRQQPHQWINVVVRGDFHPASMLPTLSKLIWAIDKSQPIFNVESMTRVIHRSTEGRRTTMYLLSFFAIIAVCLSIVGVYSVISYSISRQTHEIGIRMSLGAGRSDVIKMILKKASLLILTGTGIGLILSFSLNRTLETFIYGISRNDPSTYIFVSAMVIAVALIASVVPAMRAAKIDPVIALREE